VHAPYYIVISDLQASAIFSHVNLIGGKIFRKITEYTSCFDFLYNFFFYYFSVLEELCKILS
jgi:hypothetical protein